MHKHACTQPGGPAALSALVQVGDEIISVDGTAVTDSTVMEVMRACNNRIGSDCSLRLGRKGKFVDVVLTRAHSTLAKCARRMIEGVDALHKSLEASGHVTKGERKRVARKH
jgi:C-terminal processing protease CtpA/Prc